MKFVEITTIRAYIMQNFGIFTSIPQPKQSFVKEI